MSAVERLELARTLVACIVAFAALGALARVVSRRDAADDADEGQALDRDYGSFWT